MMNKVNDNKCDKSSEKTGKKKELKQKAIKILLILSIAYFIFLLFVLLIEYVVGETHWVFILIIYSPQALYVILPLIFICVSCFFRSKVNLLINVFSFLIVIFFLMGLNIHINPDNSKDGKVNNQLKVLTYNIHSGTYGAKKVAAFLKKSEADLIFLQEAHQTAKKTRPDPIPDILNTFPGWYHIRGGERKELMIISRYPLVDFEERKLGTFRKCLMGYMIWKNKKIRVINVHFNIAHPGKSLIRSGTNFREYLYYSSIVRIKQAEALREIIKDEKNPILLVGDFNAIPNTKTHRIINRKLTDCFEKAGNGIGYTYNSRLPMWRIDFIFVSDDFRALNCNKLPVRISDHFPLEALLELAGKK
ncbi:MAG: endonuclease/exonuclease/phosphatase family protein [Candidatus Eremiobacteraeota bacterium]|nr:endonuclease/exonuclease/phosphatase family protein [Candidatus Eremiobacteraeota bacterium]